MLPIRSPVPLFQTTFSPSIARTPCVRVVSEPSRRFFTRHVHVSPGTNVGGIVKETGRRITLAASFAGGADDATTVGAAAGACTNTNSDSSDVLSHGTCAP